MKKHVILFTLFTLFFVLYCVSAQGKDGYVYFDGYARVSNQVVKGSNSKLIKEFCRDSFSLQVKGIVMKHHSSSIQISGTRDHQAAVSSARGMVGGVRILACKMVSKKECLCKASVSVKSLPPIWHKNFPDSTNGFVDSNTAVVLAKGKAYRTSKTMEINKAQCIDVTRLNALGMLAFDMAAKKGKKELSISIPGPYTRVADCKNTGKNWSTCSCRVMLYKKGLKKSLKKAISK